MNLNMKEVSIYLNSKFAGNCTVENIVESIKNGLYTKQTELIRQKPLIVYTDGYNEAAIDLPVFTPSGIFEQGLNNEITTYNNLVYLETESLLDNRFDTVFHQVITIPTTFCCFRDVVGDSIIIIVKTSSNKEQHSTGFQLVKKFYQEQLGVTITNRGEYLNVECQVSVDPNIYYNSDSKTFKVDIKENLSVNDNRFLSSPLIPGEVYNHLPLILQKCCNELQHPREKDLFLTGAITILSGCLDKTTGTYDRRVVYPNLYSFIIAPAASGKSGLSLAKELGMSYHRNLIKSSEEKIASYLSKKSDIKEKKAKNKAADKTDALVKPNKKILYIPANSSSSAVIRHLEDSGGKAIICETEADTMAFSFKQDWGGYSDLLRKAFHHEPVTYSRKANNEFLEVEKPRIAVALSGTPSQVQGLINSAEDGLFSRFIFYAFKVQPKWRDVSPQNSINLTELFEKLSVEVEVMINFLESNPTDFKLTDDQWKLLNSKFTEWLKEVNHLVSEDATSSVKRLGLILFRIAMILSVIRKYEAGVLEKDIVCEETDFQTAFKLVEVYKQHAILMYSVLPKGEGTNLDLNMKVFYDSLPKDNEFTRQEAVAVGLKIGIKERTVDKYLDLLNGKLLFQPLKYGSYIKKM
jgi:hypothetical protein